MDPFILVKIDNSTYDEAAGDETVSVVIFEWKDEHLLESSVSDAIGEQNPNPICDAGMVQAGQCKEEELGQFLLADGADKSNNPIITQAVHLKDAEHITYPVKKTGFYCVWTRPSGEQAFDYSGVAEYRGAYGELEGAQVPKLPFYGGLTIAYAVIGIFWGMLYFQNRSDILPVQNYITAILVFLIIEELTTWGFYDFVNRNDSGNIGSKALMVVTAILNAARNSFSFFLLLIVCMGYGVVKPSLGKTMVYVRILALAHFIFGLIYGVGTLSITPDNVGPLILLVIMPLAATLTGFYVWTLNSLSATLKDLMKRKQTVKAMMYRRLWWCILGSILVIFAFFFFNSFVIANRRSPDFLPSHWKTRWFILDGWLNIVYMFDICFVAYLWRPTANNRRFAMSDELTQDEDGTFEIASIGGMSDDEEDAKPISEHQYANGGIRRETGGSRQHHDDEHEEPMSPIPPMPVQDRDPDEEAETLFAVGDDDRWSDDEEDRKDSQERSRLTIHKAD